MEQEMFSISLNQDGISWIRKIRTLARVLFFIALLTSIVDMISVFVRYYDPHMNPAKIRDPFLRQEVYVSLIYLVFWTLMFPIQAYYFYRFSKENVEAIDERNSTKFNSSFRLLMMNAVFAFVLFMINLCYIGFITYSDWVIFNKYK
jgi:hypothetical protein